MASGMYRNLGAGPLKDGPNFNQSGDKPVGTGSGAVSAIVTSPTDANIIWIGATNGGIWKTTDGGNTWNPLTDNQASLSIASLSLDPTNNALIAGIGIVDNGLVGNSGGNSFRGGLQTGLLRSTDGGTTWTPIGATALAGLSVVGVQARGATIVAATFEQQNATSTSATLGLFLSTDSGATFTRLGTGAGLVDGPATSLVGSPDSTTRLYTTITSPTAKATSGVFVSNDTGASWTQIFGAAQSAGLITAGGNQTMLRVASGPNGQVAVLVVSVNADASSQVPVGLFYSSNNGANWAQFAVPTLDTGNQSVVNTAIAIDPTNAGVVYVSGVNDGNNFAPVFRVTAAGATSMVGAGNTADGSSPSTDSRAITFDRNGNLIFGSDGGIWSRSTPTTTTGIWKGLNGVGSSGGAGFLSDELVKAVAFDGNSKRLALAMQDNAVAIETAANSSTFTALASGDGVNATFNDVTGGTTSVLYSSDQNLGSLNRNAVAPNGTIIRATVALTDGGTNYAPGFAAKFVLNKIDPTRIAIGAKNLFVTQDLVASNLAATTISLSLTDVGGAGATGSTRNITEAAYGTQDNTNALLGGGTQGLWFSSTAGAASLTKLAAYTGDPVTAVTFDVRSSSRFFASDGLKLFGSTNQGATIQDLTASLPTNFQRPVSLEFVSNYGVNELLVGGLASNATTNALGASPIISADSDAVGNLTNWAAFGSGLPNTYASALNYDAKADTLAVGLYGRGGWVMNDVTSNFASATSLQFGLADNDSTPDIAKLTGSRAVMKSGTGRLTITGVANYSGGTTISNGILQLGVITPTLVTASIMGQVLFQGSSAALALAQDIGFSNTLSGLTIGVGGAITNYIDIFAKTVTVLSVVGAGTSTSGTINLSDGASLNIAGLASTSWFANTASDGAGGTNVFLSNVQCFLRGTMIATPAGDIAVQDLQPGDTVVTRNGSRPVAWVGFGRTLVNASNRCDVAPVIVRAGAMGDGAPCRDLYVTRRHAMLVGDVLVPVEHLINGVSVLWDDAARVVEYYHIELDVHDLLRADGAWAESFRDDGSVNHFQNEATRVALVSQPPCLPVVESGPDLEAAWRTVARRVGRLPARMTDDAMDLHLVIDGVRIDGARRRDGSWWFDLPAGFKSIAIGSRTSIPASLDLGADLRRLGVAVQDIVLWRHNVGRGVRLDNPALVDGWHAGDKGHSWTKGMAMLPADVARWVGGPRQLEIRTVESGVSYRIGLAGR